MGKEVAEGNPLISRLKHCGLPEDLLFELVNDNLLVRYGKDARLFLQGKPADMLMLVVSGAVKIYCPNVSDRTFMIGLAGPGYAIGYADFIDPKGRWCEAFEAQALTNCSLALISRQRIERELSKLAPGVLVELLQNANGFWTSMMYRCAALMTMTYRERLEFVIAEVAESFGVQDARGILLTIELGHNEWAELIASSRSLVSKLISQLVDEGILEHEGKHYTLLKVDLLKRRPTSFMDSLCRNDRNDRNDLNRSAGYGGRGSGEGQARLSAGAYGAPGQKHIA
jgi:CRP-like cAMP-binding protein